MGVFYITCYIKSELQIQCPIVPLIQLYIQYKFTNFNTVTSDVKFVCSSAISFSPTLLSDEAIRMRRIWSEKRKIYATCCGN